MKRKTRRKNKTTHKSMDIQIQKRQAHDFLSQENTPRKRYARRSRRSRPNARQVNNVVQECILKNCQISEFFQQNIYSREEEQVLFQGENDEEMGEDVTFNMMNRPPRFVINEVSWYAYKDYRYEYYNPCFLGYAGSYRNSQLESSGWSNPSNRNRPACWTHGNSITGNILSKNGECTFPEAAPQPFLNEIYQEFDTFKNYYWKELSAEDIDDRIAAVRKMKKHLYHDICGVGNTAEKKSSIFSNKNFNYVRIRSMNVNVFKNIFPAVLIGNIQVRPLGVNEIVDIPMTIWEKFPNLWSILWVFITMALFLFCCLSLRCLKSSDQRNEEAVELNEQEIRNLRDRYRVHSSL